MIVVYANYATAHRQGYLDWVGSRLGPIHDLPGCVEYEAFAHPRDAERVVMVEVWETQEAFDAWATHPLHGELVKVGESDWGMRDYSVHIWANAQGHKLLVTESLLPR